MKEVKASQQMGLTLGNSTKVDKDTVKVSSAEGKLKGYETPEKKAVVNGEVPANQFIGKYQESNQ